MKKQKKPILLVLFLAILFGGVAFMNRTPPKPGEENQAPAQGAEQDKPADVAKDVASQIKSKPKPDMPKMGMKHGGPPGALSLQKFNGASERPKPNPSSTSTHWYSNEYNSK
ncbi:MAG: hypothetical protein P4L46_21515 [Fimbriimonas sp.]|nr:hypothetical protein [Fimbriimonas sp.]